MVILSFLLSFFHSSITSFFHSPLVFLPFFPPSLHLFFLSVGMEVLLSLPAYSSSTESLDILPLIIQVRANRFILFYSILYSILFYILFYNLFFIIIFLAVLIHIFFYCFLHYLTLYSSPLIHFSLFSYTIFCYFLPFPPTLLCCSLECVL